MGLAESATSSYNAGRKKKGSGGGSPPTPPPIPTRAHLTSAPAPVAKQSYHFLRFEPGIDWQQVSPTLLQRMNTLGRTSGNIISIISGFRTHAEQRVLYANYVNGTGGIAAKPGESYHERGLAVDALIDGQAIGDVLSPAAFNAVGLHNLREIGDSPHTQIEDAGPGNDLVDYARAQARKRKIPEDVFLSLINHESSWNPAAVSPAGARGLTQLMPGTAADLGVNPDDPKANIRGGAAYLAAQLKEFGSVDLALAAYNAGPGAVRSAGGVPGISETQNYVASVMADARSGNVTPANVGSTAPVASGGQSGAPGGSYVATSGSGGGAPGSVGAYPLGAPTLPYELGPGVGTDLTPQQLAETWQLIASQPGASPETLALARRMSLFGQDFASAA